MTSPKTSTDRSGKRPTRSMGEMTATDSGRRVAVVGRGEGGRGGGPGGGAGSGGGERGPRPSPQIAPQSAYQDHDEPQPGRERRQAPLDGDLQGHVVEMRL